MDTDLSTQYRRLRYLQEWINLSVDNRVQRLFFESVMQQCGIASWRFPTDQCIYEDFEGYCACREKQRRYLPGVYFDGPS